MTGVPLYERLSRMQKKNVTDGMLLSGVLTRLPLTERDMDFRWQIF